MRPAVHAALIVAIAGGHTQLVCWNFGILWVLLLAALPPWRSTSAGR